TLIYRADCFFQPTQTLFVARTYNLLKNEDPRRLTSRGMFEIRIEYPSDTRTCNPRSASNRKRTKDNFSTFPLLCKSTRAPLIRIHSQSTKRITQIKDKMSSGPKLSAPKSVYLFALQ